MKNSTSYKCYTALILVMGFLIQAPSKAFVTEYARAVEAGGTGREIHFLYDDHVGVNGVSPRRMQQQSIDSFKHNFFPTERGFLDVLQSINQTPAARSIDVIWESSTPGYTDEGATEFLAYGSTIIQREFRNLNLIHSDLARVRFEAPFLHGFDKRRDAAIYNDPVPLPQQRVNMMRQNSSSQLFNSYMSCYNASLADLKIRFKPHYDNNAQLWEDYFDKNDPFDRLADVEMLSHILASDKKIIILYAGGWHCDNIIKFLQRNGFTCTRHIENNGYELDAGFLSTLQQDCLTRGIQPARASGAPVARPGTDFGQPQPQRPAQVTHSPQPVFQGQPQPTVMHVQQKPCVQQPLNNGQLIPRVQAAGMAPVSQKGMSDADFNRAVLAAIMQEKQRLAKTTKKTGMSDALFKRAVVAAVLKEKQRLAKLVKKPVQKPVKKPVRTAVRKAPVRKQPVRKPPLRKPVARKPIRKGLNAQR